MPASILESLSAWLTAETVRSIGEVHIWSTTSGYRLCHRADLDQFGPESGSNIPPTHTLPTDARQIAKLDAEQKFRPLKSAPSLASGWLLELPNIAAVREALDYFCPAAIALWLRLEQGKIVPTHLRETLNRQTGMYRVTGLIRDEEAVALVQKACAPENCMRRILWDVSAELPLKLVGEKRYEHPASQTSGLPENVPLLCCEACNLLVAAAREVVKKRMASENATP
ncbi:MAG: DR2241 family protein [Verrucomicrobia bacterium]|nr:DR2241 family protein [Verrucomicrobiota bacterium]